MMSDKNNDNDNNDSNNYPSLKQLPKVRASNEK